MHLFLEVTPSDIQQLNDEQARELIARLCKAELLRKSVGTSAITWGGDQRAKDGGVDARVDISPSIGISGYIPRDATAYQVKAECFAPAKISGEMAPKNVLRPAIEDLVKCAGAYIIVSTKDNCSDAFLMKRRKAMSDCLKKYGVVGNIHLDFYDSRKVADWVGNNPGVLVWLRSALGNPIQGWKPFSPWAYQENSLEDEYLLDDKIKVFAPNTDEAIPVTLVIERLRKELAKSGASARIVGLSGVGKTRLVQALFDKRIVTSVPALNQENVLYTDLSDSPTPQPTSMIETLIYDDADCIVVIDNCGQDSHRKLTEIVKRRESKIRLITIEYDIRDDLPNDTVCYRLEGSSAEVIAKLLKRHYQTLSDLDIAKIVEFSDGNARVAFALASTSASKGELAHLRDSELFQRLFLQKHSANEELQRSAEAASLLYSFDVEDASADSELATLSSFAGVSIDTFYRNITELQRRGLLQERGKWRAVLPHAISNRLALDAVQSTHPSLLIQRFVTNASDRVTSSFSRRLGYLHESKHAQQMVEGWMKPDGYLGEVSSLSILKWNMLKNIAPVNQRAVLTGILRSMEKTDFTAISNPNRSHSTRLIRCLAYEPALFNDAVAALLRFALAEPDDYKSDSSRDVLQSLFYSHLSGTLAPPEQRAALVRELVFSTNAKKSNIALFLLRAGLETHHFSSHYDFDFGALKRGYGWNPRTLKEAQNWYVLFIQIAVDIGKANTALASDARTLLGAAFRGLWVDALMADVLTGAARELALIDGWPDGWIGIRNTLHLDQEHIAPESLEKLRALEIEIAPKNLQEKIQAKVLSRGVFGLDLDDVEPDSPVDRYVKAEHEARALGKAAAQDTRVLNHLAPLISNRNATNKVWWFGTGVGLAAASPGDILDQLRPLVESPPSDGVNLQFITGLINGWNQSKPEEANVFLDKALEDRVWGRLFPDLQFSIELDQAGYARLIKSLETGRTSSLVYTSLGFGRRTDPLTVTQIATLTSLLAKKSDGGLPTAIDVLYMVIHCTDTKDEKYTAELRAYCLEFVGALDWSLIDFANENFLRHLSQLIEFALDSPEPYEIASKTLTNLIQTERFSNRTFPRRLGSVLLAFFKKCPTQALDAVYTKDEQNKLVHILTVRLGRHGDTAIEVVPEEPLIEWCQVSPEDRYIFAAQTCKLFEKSISEQNSDEAVIGISSTARNILARAPDKKMIIEILVSRFFLNSWSGSLAEIMRQRLQFLDHLIPSDAADLRPLIEEIKTRFVTDIEIDEQREQARERLETGSFE